MKFVSLYEHPDLWEVPWQLLKEREAHENISHSAVPTWEAHREFIQGRPYAEWWGLMADECVGAMYLTFRKEIGIGILKAHRRKGYATEALRWVVENIKGPLLANINPWNEKSLELFRSVGFTGPIQVTLRHE